MKKLTLYTVLLVVFLLIQPAGAEIYRWVDDQGVPHYSNQKPATTGSPISAQEEIPYDAEADQQRRQAEAATWKEELERESREQEARLKLEAERLSAQTQRRRSEAPVTIIQNNVYRGSNGGAVYYPSYCADGLPPPCRDRGLTPWQRRKLYHRRYYQSSPYFRQHLYYGNTLNYRPGKSGLPLLPGQRPPSARPPTIRPPVIHPPAIGRPRPVPYHR